jgi:hypothetical protein
MPVPASATARTATIASWRRDRRRVRRTGVGVAGWNVLAGDCGSDPAGVHAAGVDQFGA